MKDCDDENGPRAITAGPGVTFFKYLGRHPNAAGEELTDCQSQDSTSLLPFIKG